ncbi:hypothetical protein JB92DRAFT_3043601 [Gautieria morchelliformis]|nr:hypothetical protein JB92DRAFT_3043601 [Gautieria morchelliformis]
MAYAAVCEPSPGTSVTAGGIRVSGAMLAPYPRDHGERVFALMSASTTCCRV